MEKKNQLGYLLLGQPCVDGNQRTVQQQARVVRCSNVPTKDYPLSRMCLLPTEGSLLCSALHCIRLIRNSDLTLSDERAGRESCLLAYCDKLLWPSNVVTAPVFFVFLCRLSSALFCRGRGKCPVLVVNGHVLADGFTDVQRGAVRSTTRVVKRNGEYVLAHRMPCTKISPCVHML